CPSIALRQWQESGAFASLVPSLAPVPKHAFDVVDFLAMPGSARRPARRTVRYAGLFVTLAPKKAGEVLASLRASRVEIQTVVAPLQAWQEHGEAIGTRWTATTIDDEAVRRWVAAIGRLEIGD